MLIFVQPSTSASKLLLIFNQPSPTKVKDKLAKMKSDLTLIIHKWECRGQSEGGRMDDVDDDEESFGNVPEVLEDTSKAV